ncbi:DUF4843 domain-containing protein [Chitinophaga niabensis]|uniref:DUF4843 domain-containing protein n=1 Tax=Chitinophaga niabensis TaxID=536979 RepID=A0A1N6FFS9_9BACT|nr:DUF4843 domain-containing protein [Chitinophaga niabensis]SIN94119.1 protein of unknown function [Chitinophaga niabensis]
MKRLIYIIAILLATASGCTKSEYLLFNDIARVQLSDTTSLSSTFVYDPVTIVKDTVYIEVSTIGGITNYDRPVKLVQIPEFDYTYVRDPITNQITDTIATERPFKAVAGTHYIDLADKSLESMMVIKAGSVRAQIPVVLLRDASLKTNSYRLRLQLVANKEFGLGEKNSREKTIVFSDRLERFYSWRVDATNASAFITFGKYSTRKHQFMIDVLKVNIDEAWFQAAVAAQALTNYANLLKRALTTFNNDPANIASGKAPLRETDSPASAAVTFP